tara:strand:- start:1724 stop:2032 length:309 start_codon:yes stop_codon:yes gene_type:complete
MTAAEGADFVRIYDVGKGFKACQELEFFGEVSGVSFSPDSTRLFVGIADVAYGKISELPISFILIQTVFFAGLFGFVLSCLYCELRRCLLDRGIARNDSHKE